MKNMDREKIMVVLQKTLMDELDGDLDGDQRGIIEVYLRKALNGMGDKGFESWCDESGVLELLGGAIKAKADKDISDYIARLKVHSKFSIVLSWLSRVHLQRVVQSATILPFNNSLAEFVAKLIIMIMPVGKVIMKDEIADLVLRVLIDHEALRRRANSDDEQTQPGNDGYLFEDHFMRALAESKISHTRESLGKALDKLVEKYKLAERKELLVHGFKETGYRLSADWS